MEFKEYLSIIRRRWLLFIPIFLLIVGAHLIWINYGRTTRFRATSKVLIEVRRDLALPANNLLPVGLHRISFNTKEATLTDYPVLRRAAELCLGRVEFRSAEFQGEHLRSQVEQGVRQMVATYGNSEDGIDKLILELQAGVRVKHLTSLQIIEISMQGQDSLNTLLMSWAMAEGAFQYHSERAQHDVKLVLTAADKRMAETQFELEAAHDELRVAQQDMGITNFQEKWRMINENLFRIDRENDQLVSKARKNDKIIEHRLQKQSFDDRNDLISRVELKNEGAAGEIRRRLFTAKLEYDAKISVLTPKHPDAIEARARVASLEKSMAKEQDNVLAAKYRAYSRETNDTIKDNAMINLELEVLAERKKRLDQDLYELNRMRQEFVPKEQRYEQARERLVSLGELRKHAEWLSEGELGTVKVYDPAVMVNEVVSGGKGLGPLSLTLLMAFIFSLGVVYIVEYVDTRVKNEHDIRRHLNLPLLGVIPKESSSSCLLTDAPPQSEVAEKFNTAATLIQSISRDLNLRSLMVCSAIAREGKTTVSINLAVALARKGARVVLVDGDLRISQVHNLLRLPNHVGLSTALDPRVDPAQIIEGVMTDNDMTGGPSSALSKVQHTQIPNLDVLTSGPPTADPVTLLDSSRLARLVGELKQTYEYVIFDTPPINKVGDALTISSVMDGCVFVVGSGQAEQQDVSWAKHLLHNVQANILGVFLNKYSKQKSSEYYYYYYDNDRKRKKVRSRV